MASNGKEQLARPEDRALLRSNPSAEAGDRADRQGCFGNPAIPSGAVVVIREVPGLREIEPQSIPILKARLGPPLGLRLWPNLGLNLGLINQGTCSGKQIRAAAATIVHSLVN